MSKKYPLDEKGYKWTFIVYPDSLPEDWKNKLDNELIRTAISPLHQPEKDGKEEERKKPHYHIILDFCKSTKTRKQIHTICKDLLNGTECEKVQSPIGIYEYLIHKNHPEREQFKMGFDEIIHLNGFNLEDFTKLENPDNIRQVLQIINDNCITEFCQLVDYILDIEPELLGTIRGDSYFLNSYLRSRRGMK